MSLYLKVTTKCFCLTLHLIHVFEKLITEVIKYSSSWLGTVKLNYWHIVIFQQFHTYIYIAPYHLVL